MFALSLPSPDTGRAGTVYGIEVAIRTFIAAWCRYTKQGELYILPEKPAATEAFLDLAAMEGIPPERCICVEGPNLGLLNKIDTIFHPDPMILNLSWLRSMHRQSDFAICGLTHTMTGVSAANVVANYVSFPTQIGDAIICPSLAIKDAIEQHFQVAEEFYNHRFGSRFKCPVETPVIPLGIDTAKFTARSAAEHRIKQRATLGIADDEVVVLFFGRLSYLSKSHPLPLLQAMARAEEQLRGKQKLRLVMMGYFDPASIEPQYQALIKDFAPNVKIDVIDRNDLRFHGDFWAGADIFTSLADNYQESFGLTPIEAMAAGLPCIVTDWDGYRDGVRHGQEGFQVPTIAPQPGSGRELAYRYFMNGGNYGEYLVSSAQTVAIDVDLLTAAIMVLAQDPAKRKAMGASAVRRAAEIYDWSVIIPQYEALWTKQAAKRRQSPQASVPQGWNAIHTGYPDPYTVFRSFPSRHLTADSVVTLACDKNTIEKVLMHQMNRHLPAVLLPFDGAVALLAWLGTQTEGSATVHQMAQAASLTVTPTVLRTVGWMAKNGFVQVKS